MSKKVRDYLFYLLIVVFVIATTIISLYAAGYQFNLSWPLKFNRLLLKTGMLVVDSNPSGAAIFLNDEQETNHSLLPWKRKDIITAAKIKNLLPGDYTLRLEQDGYWPFQKKITICSGQTTFLENINLFRSDLPFLVAPAAAGSLKLSTDEKYLYASGGNKIISLKEGMEKAITADCSGAKDDCHWMADSAQLFCNGRLIDATSGEAKDYKMTIGDGLSHWHYLEDAGKIFYQNNNSIGYFDTDSQASRIIINVEQLVDYQISSDAIFVLDKQDKKITLEKYKIDGQKEKTITIFPSAGDYRFHEEAYGYLEIYDQKGSTLYLLNLNQLEATPLKINNIISWQWLDEKTMLFNNSWEILSFDLKTGSISLLTRVSDEIDQIVWNKNVGYLIFTTDKTINTLDRETGTITSLFKTEKVLSPVLSEKNDRLYFWAKVGQQEGVFEIMLQ